MLSLKPVFSLSLLFKYCPFGIRYQLPQWTAWIDIENKFFTTCDIMNQDRFGCHLVSLKFKAANGTAGTSTNCYCLAFNVLCTEAEKSSYELLKKLLYTVPEIDSQNLYSISQRIYDNCCAYETIQSYKCYIVDSLPKRMYVRYFWCYIIKRLVFHKASWKFRRMWTWPKCFNFDPNFQKVIEYIGIKITLLYLNGSLYLQQIVVNWNELKTM